MKITLVKKADVSDKDPLIVQWVEGPEGKQIKRTEKVAIGQSLDLPDDTAYELLSKYRGMFQITQGAGVAPTVSEKTAGYATTGAAKSPKDKSLHAE